MSSLHILCFAFILAATPALSQDAHPSFGVTVTGRGPAMILIPGLLSSGEVWSSTVDHYRDRFTLHTITLAGFGGPTPVGSPFLPRVRDEVIAYIKTQRLDKPVIVGHSLGGFLAFWIAATAPDIVGGVIAVDGVPFLPALGNPNATPANTAPQAEQVKALYASFTPDQLVAQSRMALQAMISAPSDVERALDWVKRSDPAATGLAISELTATDLRAEIATITAPVLLLGAPANAPAAMRPALEKAYAAQVATLPSARVKMSPTARHFIMLDDPQWLFAAIDEFLSGR